MRFNLLKISFLVASVFMSAAQAQTLQFKFNDLGTLGGTVSWATGINDLGQVVGVSRVNTFNDFTVGALWSNGNKTALQTLDGLSSGASAINNAGQIVGYSTLIPSRFADPVSHAVTWQNGSIRDLGTVDSSFQQSYANAINRSGQIVGMSDDANTVTQTATQWNHTGPVNLTPGPTYSWANAINNAGVVAGSSYFRATAWVNGEAQDLGTLGGDGSEAFGINDHGVIVGSADNEEFLKHAALWKDGNTIDLGTLGGSTSLASGINSQGWVVGRAATANEQYHATLWIDGRAIDLNTYLSAADVQAGWVLGTANAINNAGAVVGSAYNSTLNQSHAYVLSPVPEPETWAMLLAGLGVLGMLARRRNKRAA